MIIGEMFYCLLVIFNLVYFYLKQAHVMKRTFKSIILIILLCQLSHADNWLKNASEYNIWDRLRDDFKIPDETSLNKITKSYIKWYESHPEHLDKVFENAQPYLEYIISQVEEKELPGELALLPFIESNFDPFAFSHAGATGLWQMMPGTASGYGIHINWWYDGRRDIIESTDKALNYITYLGKFFDNNWLLAIAAYDSGEGNVLKAVKKQKKLQEFNFWQLNLPKETKAYIPKLLAIKEIISRPEEHNIQLPSISNSPKFVIFDVNQQVDLNELAKVTGVSIKDIRKYNPGFRRNVTHPEMENRILIPITNKNIASSHLSNAKNHTRKKPQWIRYKVKSGDSLSKIAVDFGSNTKAIKVSNKLKNDTLKIDSYIMIPTSVVDNNNIKRTKQPNTTITQDWLPGPRLTIHNVKAGETILSIAKKYKVSVGEIEFWNKINARHKLNIRQEIVIWKKQPTYNSHKYVVKSGDSLGKIAQKNNTTISELKNINHLKSNIIVLKQTLKLP